MMFNRTMPLNFARQLLNRKSYVFVCPKFTENNLAESRGYRLRELLQPSCFIEVEYTCSGTDADNRIRESFKIYCPNGEEREFLSLRKNDMVAFIKYLRTISAVLVVDFTLLNTRFLGSFFAILSLIDWDEVYFCYTEPGAYNKCNDTTGFDLKNITMGFEQIPSLETLHDSMELSDWLVFLGFEGSRAMRIEEETSSYRRYTLPFICIPPMKPAWYNYAIEANSQFFELRVKDMDGVDFVSATNPFDTYQVLNRFKGKAEHLIITPLGPKPVMLGCIMYVLENVDDMILFDNPFQDGSNTKEFGPSHFYDLTQFIKTVKNTRYTMIGGV